MSRAYGEGGIYPEGDGFRVIVYIDGKAIKRRAKTRKDAQQIRRELLRKKDAGLHIGDGKQPLSQWLDHWLTAILPGRVKPKTLEGYRWIISKYILPTLGNRPLAKLTAQHIDNWQAGLAALGLSDGTIANARRRLSAALEAARKRKLVAENVVSLTDAPSRASAPRLVLTPEQAAVFLEHISDHRQYALYAIALGTGMRQAELFGLRWPAIDVQAGTLEVREQLQRLKDADGHQRLHRETPKTAAGRRTIPLSDDLVQILRDHQARQRKERIAHGSAYAAGDLVFVSEAGTALGTTAGRHQFRRFLARAGLPDVTFHSLRHTAGSVMLASGAQLIDVSHILGHSSVAVTARIYAHSFTEGRQKAIDLASKTLFRRAI